jgi:hypothetical protein
MEIQNIAIFAIIGAICMIVVTGGFLSMTDNEPSAVSLSTGAIAGGALGSAVSYFSALPTVIEAIDNMKGGGGGPDMKVGLPNF